MASIPVATEIISLMRAVASIYFVKPFTIILDSWKGWILEPSSLIFGIFLLSMTVQNGPEVLMASTSIRYDASYILDPII